jgi:hypothetical protein
MNRKLKEATNAFKSALMQPHESLIMPVFGSKIQTDRQIPENNCLRHT